MEETLMTFDELRQTAIDWYVNLMRIKKAETGVNEELDYQIAIQETKLQALGIPTTKLQQK